MARGPQRESTQANHEQEYEVDTVSITRYSKRINEQVCCDLAQMITADFFINQW